MQPEFWHERWRTGRIGFHLPTVHAGLIRYWPRLQLPPQSRVLVPLCGKSLDLLWLRDAGCDVVGVELSALALEDFLAQSGIAARRRRRGAFDVFESPGLELLCGDWFDLSTGQLGPVDAVYDRAALVAWPPSLRSAYLQHLAALTRSATPVLLIVLEYSQAQMPGPPFSLSRDELEDLCRAAFEVEEFGRRDALADEPRLRERGLDRLQEVHYRLTRR
ncbi:MAG: thiopurine S-methyltransferase [Steroidobacteraceae bacterium]|jgi:thiopurine S-methyltransferase